MTNEEALKEIIEMTEFATKRGSFWGEDAVNVYKFAISALKKQIQMAPVRIYNGPLFDAGWLYRCPVCGCAVGRNITAKDVTEYDNFCATCGQLLNWTALILKSYD